MCLNIKKTSRRRILKPILVYKFYHTSDVDGIEAFIKDGVAAIQVNSPYRRVPYTLGSSNKYRILVSSRAQSALTKIEDEFKSVSDGFHSYTSLRNTIVDCWEEGCYRTSIIASFYIQPKDFIVSGKFCCMNSVASTKLHFNRIESIIKRNGNASPKYIYKAPR